MKVGSMIYEGSYVEVCRQVQLCVNNRKRTDAMLS